MKRVIFFWSGATGYMAACWRALAAVPDVQLKLFVEVQRKGDTGYRHAEVLQGLDADLRFDDEPLDTANLRRRITDFQPNLMVVLGWRVPMCRFAATDPALAAIPKLFAFDMTFAFTPRKLLAPLVLRRYLRRFDGAVVTGERSALYARYLGFDSACIERGLIGLDTEPFTAACERRSRLASNPQQFLHVGRLTREKRIDLLVEAYRRYRSQVAEPWGLTCCGVGPDARLLENEAGISTCGFVQPDEMPEIHAHHSALVIASDYDPWPLVIAEAAASGLPIICTDACGSHVELVRHGFNGRVCGTGDAEGLARAMAWMHAHADELPEMGRRGLALAAPYAKEQWAAQWRERIERVSRVGR
jgi:glycosyltransferase involved in cell wall biosynthesis